MVTPAPSRFTKTSTPIVWYITGHGYGHGARSTDLICALATLLPHVQWHIVTNLPETFLSYRLAKVPFTQRKRELDVGMVQIDSVHVNTDATLKRLSKLCADWDHRVDEETTWLEQINPSLVVSDISGIPILAAKRKQIPVYALGNFGWDWIYKAQSEREGDGWKQAANLYQQAYAQTDLLLKLPFSEPMTAFPKQQEVGLLAQPGENHRNYLARLTGANPKKKWLLLSFTSLDMTPESALRLTSNQDVALFTIAPLSLPGMYTIEPDKINVRDIFASVDIVLSKPGFGVLSDCAVNKKPIIYIERKHFAEYPILEKAIKRHLYHAYLPAADFYKGNIQEAIRKLAEAGPPPSPLKPDTQAQECILETLKK